ncbi:MAG: DUF624 domain-containing protein [Ruminococcaceae bacterium]|nr:DUF624 domain-containing protein [Oscillospiraceae bacterium]
MKKNEKKKKKFKLFDLNRDGKGVYEDENRKPTLGFFFKLLFRKFGKLVRLNFIMLFQIFPIIGVAAIVIFGSSTYNTTNSLYAPLYGISQVVDSPVITDQLNMVSKQVETPLFTPGMIIGIGLLALFLFITFGWQNVGAAYVLRGMYRGDAVFIFSDYFHGIKKNWKQGLIVGMIDFACSAMLIYDLYILWMSGASLRFGFILAISIIYIFMRFYIYQILITFNIKTFKLLKNALIFSVLGILRNLLAILGIVLLIVFHIFLVFLLLPIGISIPLILPFFYIVAVIGFISVYAAYPIIDKYMIAPYKAAYIDESSDDNSFDDNIDSDEEPAKNE